MTTFTGMFSYPTTNGVSASGTLTFSLNIDAAAGAVTKSSIWGSISGTGSISNYRLATAIPGFPHTGGASSSIADLTFGTPDINARWSINGDSVTFDGNLNPATVNNGLNLDGTAISGTVKIDTSQIAGFPDVTLNMTLTGPALPTLYNLAAMNSYTYEELFSPPTGWTVVTGITAGTFESYKAVIFGNSDRSQIVICVRGTANLFNQYSDLSFFDSEPKDIFRNYVSSTSEILLATRLAYPNAHITLTGHSLGGSLVQLVGNASHYSTVAFDAPGASHLSPLLQNELAKALTLGQVNSNPEANVNVRPVGDGFSLINQSSSINLMTLISSVHPNPDTGWQILNNHRMGVLLQELSAAGTTLAFGAIEPNADVVAFGTRPAATTARLGAEGAMYLYLLAIANSNRIYWLDPSLGSQVIFQESSDSPSVTSLQLMADPNIASYKVWTQANGAWSAPQTVAGGGLLSLPVGTHVFKISGFSASGQPVALPSGFTVGATFASTGQAAAKMQSINFDSFDGVNVQTPVLGASSLNVNSSFRYTDAGNGALTVNGTPSGNDTIVLGSGSKTVNLGSGTDFVMVKSGATGNITIRGSTGDETILAGAANVTLVAGTGNILFIGGDDANANVGVNVIDYSAIGGAVKVNLSTGIIQTPNVAINTLVNVENVIGSPFADQITGDSRANRLNGAAGADVLTGGPGSDKFVFDAAALADAKATSAIIDQIKDYNAAESDQIDLSALLAAARAAGQSVGSLVRAVADASGNFSRLQVDTDGTANGVNWVTIAQLDGLRVGNNLSIILDSALPAGSTISVIAPPSNRAPAITAASVNATKGQVLSAASFFSASDPDGDALSYWFRDNTNGGGHFEFDGVAKPDGQTFGVSLSQLSRVTYRAGSSGADNISINLWDGQASSAVVGINVNVVNQAPTLTASSVTAAKGQVLSATSLFSASDPDGDALSYWFRDNTVGGGRFEYDGVAKPEGQTFGVSASQLSHVTYRAGTSGADNISINVWDGQASSPVASINVTPVGNTAPALTASSVTAGKGQVLAASSLFSANDPDGDALSYWFRDNTAGGGHFEYDGVAKPEGQTFGVSLSQLSHVTYRAGTSGADNISINVWDGQASSPVASINVTPAGNTAPTLTATSISAAKGQVISASSLFSAGDADGDALSYWFRDNSAGGGRFEYDGVPQAEGQTFGVSQSQLSHVTFRAGNSGADNISINAWDGQASSPVASINVTIAGNHAPTLTASNTTVAKGQVVAASGLFTANDSDGDTLSYWFRDNTVGGGRFEYDGVPQAEGQTFGVSQSQLSHLTFHAATSGSDSITVNAWDGQASSALVTFQLFV